MKGNGENDRDKTDRPDLRHKKGGEMDSFRIAT